MSIFQHRFFVNFSKYRFLLTELVKKDIKVKYKDSILGLFWSFLNPLLTMIVLVLVFGFLFGGRGSGIPNFAIYVLIGRLSLDLFTKGTKSAMNAIRRNKNIIKKLYVPKYMFVLAAIISELINFLISLVVLIMVMIVTQNPFAWIDLISFIPVLFLFIFTIGAGLILATATSFFTDIKYLFDVFTMLLMYGSAVFYPINIIPEKYQLVFYLNPVYVAIEGFRDAILYQRFPKTEPLIYLIGISFAALIIGLIIFYKYQDEFILHV